jgi:hypothetical protein
VHGRQNGKKCNKGGQHALLLDAQRRYIYAWTPCHKFFEVKSPFTAMGPAEVVCMMDIIRPLVKGETMEPTDKRRKIFDEKVHVPMDNFFSGDEILRYLGEDGWKATITCRCDWLPKGVPKHISTTSKQCQSMQDPKLQDLSNQSLLLRMSYSPRRNLELTRTMQKGREQNRKKMI